MLTSPESCYFTLEFFMYFKNTASSATQEISLCRRTLELSPGLLQLWHWQSDALNTRLDLIPTRQDLIPNSARSHPLGFILYMVVNGQVILCALK